MTKPPRPPTESALDAARAKITEALAILEGPLAEAAAAREAKLPGARASGSAQDPAVREFCNADARHAKLENLVAVLRDAQNRTIEGAR